MLGSIQTLTILNVPEFGTAYTCPSVARRPVFWLSYVGRYDKHQFESLFEYKSDDEDDSNMDAKSLEDKTTVTIQLRLKKLRAETSKVICNSV